MQPVFAASLKGKNELVNQKPVSEMGHLLFEALKPKIGFALSLMHRLKHAFRLQCKVVADPIHNIRCIPVVFFLTQRNQLARHAQIPGLLKRQGMTDHAASPLLRRVTINNACFLTP